MDGSLNSWSLQEFGISYVSSEEHRLLDVARSLSVWDLSQVGCGGAAFVTIARILCSCEGPEFLLIANIDNFGNDKGDALCLDLSGYFPQNLMLHKGVFWSEHCTSFSKPQM